MLKPDLSKAFCFDNAIEWREWLEKNHLIEKEAFLIHFKKHTGKKSLSYPDALDEALCFGWIDNVLRKIDSERFVLRYTPRKTDSVWSKINREKCEKLIKEGRMQKDGLKKIEEAKKNGLWEKAYTNKEKERMLPDLKKALQENKIALKNFEKFANTYRNMYIGWIKSAKTVETRNKRIVEVVKLSEKNKKAAYL